MDARRNSRVLVAVAGVLALGFCVGCAAGPSYRGDTNYRAIERDADRNSAGLSATGAAIATDVERIAGHAARVVSELGGLEAAILDSSLGATEKGPLLLRAETAKEEATALASEVATLRENAGRLNDQLVEEREINAALSREHDKREAAAAEVKKDLAVAREKLAKVSGQRNLAVVIAAALALAIIGYIVIRVLRFLRVIPV
jgi:chromosome segregation ATPase